MLFNSHAFVFAFLPIALAGYLLLARLPDKGPARLWLLGASCAFYLYWSAFYLALLLAIIAANFQLAALIRRLDASNARRASRYAMLAGVAFDLGVLGWYKYSVFVAENVGALAGVDFAVRAVVLPLGISFYTFQQIAYLVDTWRGHDTRCRLIDYALFVTFFPQLIAGPIVHHHELTPQFRAAAAFEFSHRRFAEGIGFFVIGLGKKLLLADPLSDLADPLFGNAAATQPGLADGWIAVLAFGFGLYFDFSAYSDMAVGLARMFGYQLPYNFASPYQAVSIIDFWRRWHMTLSRFLRDYVYIGLGGNRHGPARRYLNLMLTMLLGGLWHGAGWNFVIWGGLHGVFLLGNHAWRAFGGRMIGGALGSQALTLLAVMVAWVFFRAATLPDALAILKGMAGLHGLASEHAVEWFVNQVRNAGVSRPFQWRHVIDLLMLSPLGNLALLGLGAAIALLAPNSQQLVDRAGGYVPRGRLLPSWLLRWDPTPGWAAAMALMVLSSILLMSSARVFVYFQF
jgi:alginate O-acetyltransferase complex protein AlgI